MDVKQMNELMERAKEARRRAYAPYSRFSVGAALLCADGETVLGCNVENASYSPTCCAERVALFSAISRGKRDFSAIAVVGGSGEDPQSMVTPCGVCRQVLAEFCSSDFEVLLLEESGDVRSISLGELLPLGFSLS